MKNHLRTILIALLATIALASVLSRPRKSEKGVARILSGAQVPPPILAMIDRACQDCHSERAYYPWYSYVVPVSWFISEIANQIRDREMPLPLYMFMHRGAKLSESDVEALFQWTQTERSRLIAESGEQAR